MKVRIALVVFLVVIIVLPVSMMFLTDDTGTNSTSPTATATPTPSTAATATSSPNNGASVKMNMEIKESDFATATQVILKTNLGDIRLDLFKDKSPKTVQNFVTLGKVGYYEGVIFHRVIEGFMIQGGDPTGTGTSGKSIYGARFADEINDQKIVKGSLAMANSGPNTNGSQFFIVTSSTDPEDVDNKQTHLDGKHTNFGKVADDASMAVVQKIAATPVGAGDKPRTAVVITGFEIVK